MAERPIDLDSLGLRGGEAERIDLELDPPPPLAGGEELAFEVAPIAARVDVSRTTSGYALRLRAGVVVLATCDRCLGPARIELAVDAREVEQGDANDPDLRSPYVSDGLLEPARWLHDAIVLSMPEQIRCQADCAGLCAVCGVSLNEVDPSTHTHDPGPDPRFAKLRELLD